MMRAVIARSPDPRPADGRRPGAPEMQRRRWPSTGQPEAGGEPDLVGDVVEALPSRCPKPAVATAALARLVREAEERLAMASSPFGAALGARWPEPPRPVPVLRPSPALPAYALPPDRVAPNAVFALFGLDADGQRAAIERVLREQGGAVPFVPVFLTNDPDFWPLRAARLVFEYYPFVLADSAGPPPAGWAAYVVDMLQLTMRRWGVRRIVQA